MLQAATTVLLENTAISWGYPHHVTNVAVEPTLSLDLPCALTVQRVSLLATKLALAVTAHQANILMKARVVCVSGVPQVLTLILPLLLVALHALLAHTLLLELLCAQAAWQATVRLLVRFALLVP